MFNGRVRPGVLNGRYPQKNENNRSEFEKYAARNINDIKFLFKQKKFKQKYIVNKVDFYENQLKQLSEGDLTRQIGYIRNKLQQSGLQEPIIIQAFATIREVADRTLGKRHYDTQLFGGWVMINGMIAEMQTGEGKTLAVTLPSCTAALAGIPVHVITANDYLAARDAEIMQPLYKRLGLVAGSVTESSDINMRYKIYRGDIVHTTNKQIAFDYLRDRIEISNNTGHCRFQFKQIERELQKTDALLLRGLCFAIIDEADSVLIDEAITPLIISKEINADENEITYVEALHLATNLFENKHFFIDFEERSITLTESGENCLADMTKYMSGLWQGKRRRETLIKLALVALHIYKLDKHYIVRDDKIHIIDQNTGRAMPGQTWELGLHQMIEVKEGCIITSNREPLARISYQKFFSRYCILAGTSGTVKEVSGELNSVYGLKVIDIPTHKSCKRKLMPVRLYNSDEYKWKALLAHIKEINGIGRPILIGTCSVTESEELSAKLTEHHLVHQVLNARQDEHEAEIITHAGQLGKITVATNVAGRGTDIELGPDVSELGGLHVVSVSRNDARRIGRQLIGRCARQGDPGSVGFFMSLDDGRITFAYPRAFLKILKWLSSNDKPMPVQLAGIILRWPQKKIENKHYQQRRQVIKQDKQQVRILAFSGRFD